MFLLEQYDSAGKQGPTVQGPRRDHLGSIFGHIRKLISRRLGIDLGSILLLEAGLYRVLGAAAKCRLPYNIIIIFIIIIIIIIIQPGQLQNHDASPGQETRAAPAKLARGPSASHRQPWAQPATTTMIYGKILEIDRKYMPKICPKWAHNGPFELSAGHREHRE